MRNPLAITTNSLTSCASTAIGRVEDPSDGPCNQAADHDGGKPDVLPDHPPVPAAERHARRRDSIKGGL